MPMATDSGSRRDSRRIVLPHVLRAQAEGEHGDERFIRAVGGGWKTFQDVHATSRALAGGLERLGVTPGDRVGVMVPTSCEAVELWGAVTYVGAIEVPIHTELRGGMLSHVLNDSGAKVAVIEERFVPTLWDVVDQLPSLETVVVLSTDGAMRSSPPANSTVEVVDGALLARGAELENEAIPEYWDVAAIMYTSGTTGPAKGVMIPWGQWFSGINGLFPDVEARDCFYVPLPLHHIAGRGMVYRAAMCGGRALLRERFSVSEYWTDVHEGGCTATILMGGMADMLANQPPCEAERLNPLEKVLMSPLIADVAGFERRFDVALRTNFGMTEIGGPIVGGVERPLANEKSCGRPRAGYECRVVDEHDEVVPPGEIGELVLRTDRPWMIMSGYWNAPDKTAASWRNQWFHTGDAFRCDDEGNFYFVDRVKDAIRRNGENISSFHLEKALLEHPDVAECAVVGVPSAGTEEEVRAFVVLADGAAVRDMSELSEFLEPRVARFMLPRYWTPVAELPKTATLRVRKGQLRELPLDPGTWDRRNK